jgi:hypothetical protein
MIAWFKQNWKEHIGGWVIGAMIDGLIYLGFRAAHNPVNPWLFAASAFPLTMVGLGLINRIAPRRPDIRLKIEAFSILPPRIEAGGQTGPSVFVRAKVTNRGVPTSLDDWKLSVEFRGHDYDLATWVPAYPFYTLPGPSPDPGGRVIRLYPQEELAVRTAYPIGRGTFIRGWMVGEARDLDHDSLSKSTVHLRCADTWGKTWQSEPLGKLYLSTPASLGFSAGMTPVLWPIQPVPQPPPRPPAESKPPEPDPGKPSAG